MNEYINKIGIDCRTISQGGGVSVYVKNLAPTLARTNPNILFYIFLIDNKYKEYFEKFKNIRVIVIKIPKIFILFYDLFLLPIYSVINKIDLFHGPKSASSPLFKLFGIKTITTIHDVIPLTNPETEKFVNKIYWNIQIPLAYKTSDYVITDSNFSKDELEKKYGKRDNISVVYLGADIPNESSSQVNFGLEKENLGINKQYLVYVGTLQPRKNVLNLIKAYNSSKIKNDYQLVLVGKKGWLYEEIFNYVKENQLEQNVIFTGFVDENLKFELIKNASALAFISINEGFGIPIIEGMSFDIPVLTSNVSCMPEIGGDAALYCNPFDIEDIKNNIENILLNKELRISLIKKAKVHVKQFNWDKCADETFEIYKKFL